MASLTNEEMDALETTVAMGQAIKELGNVPKSHLYIRVMNHMTLDVYNKIIAILVKTGAVKEEHQMLTWIGG